MISPFRNEFGKQIVFKKFNRTTTYSLSFFSGVKHSV